MIDISKIKKWTKKGADKRATVNAKRIEGFRHETEKLIKSMAKSGYDQIFRDFPPIMSKSEREDFAEYFKSQGFQTEIFHDTEILIKWRDKS